MYAKSNDKLNTYYYPKWKTIIIIIDDNLLLARMESSYTCIKSSLFRSWFVCALHIWRIVSKKSIFDIKMHFSHDLRILHSISVHGHAYNAASQK